MTTDFFIFGNFDKKRKKKWNEPNVCHQNLMTKICNDANNNCWTKFGKSDYSVARGSQGSLLVNTTVH